MNADLRDLVQRTHQLHLLVPSKITEIENPDLTESQDRPERTRIFGLVTGTLL
jgi:hypothetical protein